MPRKKYRKKKKRRVTERISGMNVRTTSITFMLIGLIASFGVLFANDRGIIIDDVVADMTNTTAWELAFGVYMLFVIGGIVVEMLLTKPTSFSITDDFFAIIINNILFIISIFVLSATASGVTGGLSTAITNMQTEFYNWSTPYALVYIVYIIHSWIVKN